MLTPHLTERIASLASANHDDAPIFGALLDRFAPEIGGGPIDCAADAPWSELEESLSALLPHDDYLRCVKLLGAVAYRTTRAAFACGLVAGGGAQLLKADCPA